MTITLYFSCKYHHSYLKHHSVCSNGNYFSSKDLKPSPFRIPSKLRKRAKCYVVRSQANGYQSETTVFGKTWVDEPDPLPPPPKDTTILKVCVKGTKEELLNIIKDWIKEFSFIMSGLSISLEFGIK